MHPYSRQHINLWHQVGCIRILDNTSTCGISHDLRSAKQGHEPRKPRAAPAPGDSGGGTTACRTRAPLPFPPPCRCRRGSPGAPRRPLGWRRHGLSGLMRSLRGGGEARHAPPPWRRWRPGAADPATPRPDPAFPCPDLLRAAARATGVAATSTAPTKGGGAVGLHRQPPWWAERRHGGVAL
jgi:hypothetical protein